MHDDLHALADAGQRVEMMFEVPTGRIKVDAVTLRSGPLRLHVPEPLNHGPAPAAAPRFAIADDGPADHLEGRPFGRYRIGPRRVHVTRLRTIPDHDLRLGFLGLVRTTAHRDPCTVGRRLPH